MADVPDAAEGRAFPPLVSLLVSAMTVATFVAGMLALDRPAIQEAAWSAKLLIVAGLAVLVLFNYWVFKSRTRVDARQIHQTWIWTKHVEWADVVQAKMIYVPYLSWIIAPRLVVRGRSGMVTLFHASDMAVLETFTRYALAPQLRQG